MVNQQKVESFINFQYVPFKKRECVEWLAMIWILSIALYFCGKITIIWTITAAILACCAGLVFLPMLFAKSTPKIYRFVSDGAGALGCAIALNLCAYRVFALTFGSNIVVLILFVLLLVVNLLSFYLLVNAMIQKGIYSESCKPKGHLWLPFAAGLFGILIARTFLEQQTQKTIFIVLIFILLLLSFILCLASMNLLRAFLLAKCFPKNAER